MRHRPNAHATIGRNSSPQNAPPCDPLELQRPSTCTRMSCRSMLAAASCAHIGTQAGLGKQRNQEVSMKLRLPLVVLFVCWTASGQTYTISTLAGGALPVNIPGTAATLTGAAGVAVDAKGNLFFTNVYSVLRLDATTGILTLVAGNGTPGFSGDNGLATGAQLEYSAGLSRRRRGGFRRRSLHRRLSQRAGP